MRATENWILEFVQTQAAKLPKLDSLVDIGDDAYVFKSSLSNLVVAQDTMVKNVHWDPDFSHFGDVGFKSLAVNLSDLASMGAKPLGALVSLALEPDATQEQVTEFYAGFSALCQRYKVALLGGDVVRSNTMAVTVTVLGQITEGCWPLTRTGAQPGHIVWASGILGLAEEGLEMLLKWKKEKMISEIQKSFEGVWKQCQRHRRPEPRIMLGLNLCHQRLASACIDTSDSVAKSLILLCQNCGIQIDQSLLKKASGNRDTEFVLRAGEDFELIFTSPENNGEEIKKLAHKLKLELNPIGVCTDQVGKCVLINDSGHEMDIKDTGFQHFG